MSLHDFVEGPLLWIVSILFVVGVLTRLSLHFISILKKALPSGNGPGPMLAMLIRSFLPYHIAAAKQPLYAALLYIFHGCLFIVPIWYSGHIVLWEESRFQLSWTVLPDAWADALSLITMGILIFFIIKHFFTGYNRQSAKWSDVLLILITLLPFLSGYVLVHGQLDHILFLRQNIFTIHILTAEVMFLMVIFLMCRPIINEKLCTGCAACEVNCITGALDAVDGETRRSFSYVPSQCISCGGCVITCPEKAVSLRHVISIKKLLQMVLRKEIRSVDLMLCEICGAPVGPVPQIKKIFAKLEDKPIRYCSECREESLAETFYQVNNE